MNIVITKSFNIIIIAEITLITFIIIIIFIIVILL